MNVSSQNERTELLERFRNQGFDGKIFDVKKGKYTYSSQARRFARTKVIEGQSNLVPSGMIYDTINNQFVKTKSVMSGRNKKKQRLQKRFTKLGIKFNKRQKALLPPQNMLSRLSGTIDVVLEKVNRQGQLYQFNTQYQTTVPFSAGGNWKQRLIDELQERINSNGTNAEIISATTQDIEFFPKQGQTGIQLDSLRLRKVFLRIDNMEEQPWDTGKDECVLDFLKWYYKDDDRLPKGLLDDDTFDFCFEKEYKKEGVSTLEIENWCMLAQIKMIALDEDYKVIRLYKPHQPSKAKVLIYIIKNCHINPIINPTKIRSITEIIATSELVKGKTKRVRDIIQKETKEVAQLPVSIINDDMRGKNTNLQYLCKMMIDNKIDVLGKKIKWGKVGPEQFVMDGEKYVFHHKENDVVKNFLESKDQQYVGQKPSQYVYEAMEKFDIKISRCNSKLNELFSTENSKHKIHEGGKIVTEEYMDFFNGVEEFDWSTFPDAITFDINKCHTSILQNPQEEWYIFTFRDEPEPFLQLDELLPGMYYVETDDKRLFMGNKFYSKAFVQKGLDEGLINKNDIKYQIICRNLLDKDYFKGLFGEYEKQTDMTDEGIEMRKILNNTTTGILGKTKYQVVDKRITTDIHTAYEYLINNYDKDIFNYRIPVQHNNEEHNFYCYGQKYNVLKENNNFAMYNQVLDNQAMLLYDYIKLLTCNDWNKLLHRKTDAFTIIPSIQGKKFIPTVLGEEIGELKIIKNPSYPRVKPYKNIDVDWSQYIKDWTIVDDIKSSYDHEVYYKYIKEGKSLMTIGEGGSGKSHIIKKIQEKYNAMTLAFTNCAALNVGGKTIHRTFKYDSDGECVSKKTINFVVKNSPDCFIIDEDEMLSGNLWKLVYEVKKRTNVPFFLFGDWCQLKNFDGCKYKNHSIIKSICDYNITPELEYHENCRMSPELRNLIKPYREEGNYSIERLIPEFERIYDVSDLPFTNICFSNNAKRKINRDMNAYHYAEFEHIVIDKSIKILIDKYWSKSFTEKRPFELFKPHIGMPLICIKNNYDVTPEKNGQRFIITKIYREDVLQIDENNIRQQYEQVIGPIPKLMKDENIKKEIIKELCYPDRVEISCKIKNEIFKYDISLLHLMLNFDMAYAMTNHKVIGLTERDICIHQLSFPFIDNTWIYTAFSRGTQISDIKLCFAYH